MKRRVGVRANVMSGKTWEEQGCLGSSQQMGRIGLVLNASARAGEVERELRVNEDECFSRSPEGGV